MTVTGENYFKSKEFEISSLVGLLCDYDIDCLSSILTTTLLLKTGKLSKESNLIYNKYVELLEELRGGNII